MSRTTILRHARISRDQVRAFWDRVVTLTEEYAQLPRSGDTVYGFAAGIYPTDHPTLPEPDPDDAAEGRDHD